MEKLGNRGGTTGEGGGGNCRMGSKNVNKLRSAVGGVNVEIGAGERVS